MANGVAPRPFWPLADSVKGFCINLGHDCSAGFLDGVTGTMTLITGCDIERSESPVPWRRACQYLQVIEAPTRGVAQRVECFRPPMM
jgi:hypothetical protein